MDMNQIRRNYLLNTLFHVLRLLTPLVVTPYLSRVLGVDGVGTFSYTYSVQTFFSLAAVLGTSAYGSREIARHRDDVQKASCLFWEIWLLSVGTALVSLLGWGILILFSDQHRLYYTILTFCLLAAMLDISWFYTGLEQFPVIALRNIGLRLAEAALIFLLVKQPEHLYRYVLIMAGGTFLGSAALWAGVRRNLCSVSWHTLRPLRHLRQTFIYFLPSVATSVYTVLDKTLIGMITGDAAENGAYEQATKIMEVAKALAFTSLNVVLSPRSAYLCGQGRQEEARRGLHSSLNFMLLLSVGMAFGIAGVAGVFVPWFFGDGFEGVVLLLRCLSPILVVIAVSNALGYQYYDPAGLRQKSAGFLAVGAGCNLVLNCLMIPRFGGAGAVVGSVVSELVITALYLEHCDGWLRLWDLLRMGWRKVIAGVVMLPVLLRNGQDCAPVTSEVLLLILQGILIYLTVLLLLREPLLIDGLKRVQNKLRREV